MATEPQSRPRTRDPVEEAARHWSERYPDAPRFRALTSLVRGYGVALRGAEALLRPLELNLSRFEILLVLSFSRRGELRISRLRDALMMHGSSVTYLVDRLELVGLVVRVPDARDRRVVRVRLTDRGREVTEHACRALVEGGFGPLAGIDQSDLDRLSDLVTLLHPDPDAPSGN